MAEQVISVNANDVIAVLQSQRNQAMEALVICEAKSLALLREIEELKRKLGAQSAAASEVAPTEE